MAARDLWEGTFAREFMAEKTRNCSLVSPARPHRKGGPLSQLIAVTLVTSMLLTMPGVQGWAQSDNAPAQPNVAVQPNGVKTAQAYKPLVGRYGGAVEKMTQLQQLWEAMLNFSADHVGI